jgi:hypothetical protein
MSDILADGVLTIKDGRIWLRRELPAASAEYLKPLDVTEAIAVILAPYIARLSEKELDEAWQAGHDLAVENSSED